MRVELEGVESAERLDAVRAGRLDAAFVRFGGDAPGLVVVPAWREPLLAALPLGFPPCQWPGVRLDRLSGLPLLLVARERNPVLHDLVLRRCRGTDLVAPARAVTGLRDALAAVARGAGWTVVPESLVATGRPDGVACLPFDPQLSLPVHFAVRDRDEYTYLLLEACREVMAAVPGTTPATAGAVLAPAGG
jgi:DNA-binding transcriptional LysR family regulator